MLALRAGFVHWGAWQLGPSLVSWNTCGLSAIRGEYQAAAPTVVSPAEGYQAFSD